MTYRFTDAQDVQKAAEWLQRHWGKSDLSEYFHARSLTEAAGLLREFGKEAAVIAGGTDLLGLMKNRVKAPQVFVNLKSIEGLNQIKYDHEGLTLGPLVSINDLQKSKVIQENYPILYQTACAVASPQIRNMATVGGNLLQDVRCWYFRRSPDTGITYDCRRKNPQGRCFAVNGENQYHAIVGGSQCWAVLGSDLATSLLALNALVRVEGVSGEREMHLEDLYTPLGHTLAPGDVISEIRIPCVDPDVKQHFLKFRVRKTIDFAIVSAAVKINLENERVREARIVMGGFAHKPWRVTQAEETLIGERLEEKSALEATSKALEGITPLSKNAYKIKLARVLIKRAILGENL